MVNFFGGDDPTNDPQAVIAQWLAEAKRAGDVEVEAVHLATVDKSGLPDLRVVYIREFAGEALVFYTNYQSRKGEQLQSGKAAINYYFPKWQRQIRLRGLVEKASAERSDAYFLARPEGSRLGAWMSQQSQEVDSRETMEAELEALPAEKANARPPHWGGYVFTPLEIEFWAMGEFRIHNRFRWSKEGTKWRCARLYP